MKGKTAKTIAFEIDTSDLKEFTSRMKHIEQKFKELNEALESIQSFEGEISIRNREDQNDS